MSYLRRLVRKTQAPRLQIAPRAKLAGGEAELAMTDLVEDVVVPRAPAATAGQAPVVLPSPPPRLSPAAPEAREGPREADRAEPLPAIVAAPVAVKEDVPRIPRETPSPQVVNRRMHAGRRSIAEPREAVVPAVNVSALPADLDSEPIVAADVPRPDARDVLPRRDHEPYPAAAPPPEREPPTDVHISIGRVEVRATVAAPAKADRPATFRPRLTLDDYLARRSRGP
jgi:hypothetical protein